MKVRLDRAVTVKGECMDLSYSLGMMSVLHVMGEKHGWGPKRLPELLNDSIAFLEQNVKPKAPKFSPAYRDELEYAFARMTEGVQQMMQPRGKKKGGESGD